MCPQGNSACCYISIRHHLLPFERKDMTKREATLGAGVLSASHSRPLLSLVLVFLIAVAVWGGAAMQLSLDNLMLLWPAGAVSLGGLWLLGWRWGVVAVVLGALIGSTSIALPEPQLVARTVAVLMTGLVGSFSMRWLRVDQHLSGVRDMLLFLAFAVILAPVVGNLAGAAVHFIYDVQPAVAASTWWHCGVAEIVACLLLLPLVFSVGDTRNQQRDRFAAYACAVLAVSGVVYFDLLPMHLSMTLPLAYIAFPLMLAAAFHLSLRAVAALLFFNGLMALWGTAHSMGPFTLSSSAESIVALQGHLALLSGTSLLLSAALAERRRSMVLQRQSEERYRLIVEHQSEALIKTNASGQVLYATPSAREWVHEEADDNFLLWLSERCPNCSYISMRARLMSGERVSYDHTAGESVLRWTLSPVRGEGNALESVIAVGHDVTVECGAEQRAHRHLEELSHLGRLSDMAQMAGGLAHELNQPLTAVMAFAQAAERLLPAEADTKNTRQALERVVGNTKRAAEIVRHARNFMGNKNAEHRVQDMLKVTRDAMALVDFETRRYAVKLSVAPISPVPWARVSSVQIHQILVNLIRNAMQAMAEQSGEKKIILQIAQDKERMWIDVVDSGPGMDPEITQNAFDPFSGTRGDGLGLGLSICRAIAESHGGSMSLEPVEKGTCVRLTLPLEVRDDGYDDDEVAELFATIA